MEKHVGCCIRWTSAVGFCAITFLIANTATEAIANRRTQAQEETNIDYINEAVNTITDGELMRSFKCCKLVPSMDIRTSAHGPCKKSSECFGNKMNYIELQDACQEAVHVRVKVTEKDLFRSDLNNSSSLPFKQLSQAVEQKIDSFFKNVISSSSFVSAKVVQFRKGSIIADVKLEFADKKEHDEFMIRKKREVDDSPTGRNSPSSTIEMQVSPTAHSSPNSTFIQPTPTKKMMSDFTTNERNDLNNHSPLKLKTASNYSNYLTNGNTSATILSAIKTTSTKTSPANIVPYSENITAFALSREIMSTSPSLSMDITSEPNPSSHKFGLTSGLHSALVQAARSLASSSIATHPGSVAVTPIPRSSTTTPLIKPVTETQVGNYSSMYHISATLGVQSLHAQSTQKLASATTASLSEKEIVSEIVPSSTSRLMETASKFSVNSYNSVNSNPISSRSSVLANTLPFNIPSSKAVVVSAITATPSSLQVKTLVTPSANSTAIPSSNFSSVLTAHISVSSSSFAFLSSLVTQSNFEISEEVTNNSLSSITDSASANQMMITTIQNFNPNSSSPTFPNNFSPSQSSPTAVTSSENLVNCSSMSHSAIISPKYASLHSTPSLPSLMFEGPASSFLNLSSTAVDASFIIQAGTTSIESTSLSQNLKSTATWISSSPSKENVNTTHAAEDTFMTTANTHTLSSSTNASYLKPSSTLYKENPSVFSNSSMKVSGTLTSSSSRMTLYPSSNLSSSHMTYYQSFTSNFNTVYTSSTPESKEIWSSGCSLMSANSASTFEEDRNIIVPSDSTISSTQEFKLAINSSSPTPPLTSVSVASTNFVESSSSFVNSTLLSTTLLNRRMNSITSSKTQIFNQTFLSVTNLTEKHNIPVSTFSLHFSTTEHWEGSLKAIVTTTLRNMIKTSTGLIQPTASSPITSISRVPIASSKQRIVECNVTIVNRPYTSQLSNSSSKEYMKTSNEVETSLTSIINSTLGFLHVQVLGFRNGSVVTNFHVVLGSFSNITAQGLGNLIEAGNGTNTHRLIFSKVTVEELCTSGFCSNHGACTKILNSQLQCSCNTGYTGPRCNAKAAISIPEDDEDDFEKYWIVIGVCIGLFVLIIILLILLAFRRRRKYYVTRESVMSIGRTSGDVFFNPAYGHSQEYLTNDKSSNVIPLEVVYENNWSSSFKNDAYHESEFISSKSKDEDEEEDIYKTQLLLFLKRNNLLKSSSEDTPKHSWASSRSSVSTGNNDSGL